MEDNVIKKILPQLVKNVSKFFELDLTIRLFGVPVLKFHWPPESEK